MIFPLLMLLALAGSACSGEREPQVIYITATFPPPPNAPQQSFAQPTAIAGLQREDNTDPAQLLAPGIQPTADSARTVLESGAQPQAHVVQSGDTMYGIALTYGISLDSLVSVNELVDPNALSVGQTIQLPDIPTEVTPDFKIIPDSRMVRGPGSIQFDVGVFIAQQPGYIRTATGEVPNRQANGFVIDEIVSATEIVQRVALEYSVDPRLLLALLEYRSGWLSNPDPAADLKLHPMISEADSGDIDREGLYRQLTWTADQLNRGYYGWKYRAWTTLEFDDGGPRVLYNIGLNAGTVALQYFLSQNTSFLFWLRDVTLEGFYQTYHAYFGDPFVNAIDPIVPNSIQQPEMTFPFAQGEVWFFTGGWHGGWNTGSAWSALDFAPPDEPSGVACYTSQFWVRAVAPGVIARSNQGAVVLDLDGDGDESTGWTVFYLHLDTIDRAQVGTQVTTGDPIGRASCEGGFSTATHLHIGRRYNGEWIPADCPRCSPQDQRPKFTMSGWSVVGYVNQEYQGHMENNGQRRVADQGRFNPENRISW